MHPFRPGGAAQGEFLKSLIFSALSSRPSGIVAFNPRLSPGRTATQTIETIVERIPVQQAHLCYALKQPRLDRDPAAKRAPGRLIVLLSARKFRRCAEPASASAVQAMEG